jgi:hypothetical protein
MKHSLGLLFCCGLFALSAAPIAAQGIDGEPVRCIQTTRIDRTEVIGDQLIVFHMRGRDNIFINRLDRACPGLDRGRPFSYRSTNSRLCNSDSITVLENSAFGLTRGFTCGLGVFEPSNAEAIALLKGEQEEAEVTVIDVEVEDEDEDTVEDEE